MSSGSAPRGVGVWTDRLFRIGMWWRAIYGVAKLGFGVELLRLVGHPLSEEFRALMSHQLVESRSDVLVRSVGSFLDHHPVKITYFLAAYFIFWGALDAVLSASILRKRHWAFAASTYLIGAFVAYEVFRVLHTRSPILVAIIVIDLATLYLIGRERDALEGKRGSA